MPFFRCHGLNERGRIVAATELDGPDLATAVQVGQALIAAHPTAAGLEIWSGTERLFSTHPPPACRSEKEAVPNG